MKTDLAPTPTLDVMPRADLPVIWDGFKAKAEELRATAETLVVSSVDEKDKMELARTTRLTLKQIRIAVEKKRVELGEGHLAEIQKINGAAKKLKDLIEPLEARLQLQESFAERFEADRIRELGENRRKKVLEIRPGIILHWPELGPMSADHYDQLLSRLRREAEEIAEAKRKQAEAEAQLAKAEEQRRLEQAQAQREREEQQAEAQRQARAAAAEAEAKLAAERAEHRRQEEELLSKLAAQRAEENRIRAEREAEEKRIRDEREAVHRAELAAIEVKRNEELKIEAARRLELEVQLANERAAKLAEEKRKMELELAPDVEKLWKFAAALRGIQAPGMVTPSGISFVSVIYEQINSLALNIEVTCKSWGLTKF